MKKLISLIAVGTIVLSSVFSASAVTIDNNEPVQIVLGAKKAKSSSKVTFSKKAGTYENSVNVTLSAPKGAKIYYTTNGKTPTTKSKRYSKALSIKGTVTVKAIYVLNGKSSPVASAKYTIRTSAPKASVKSGVYEKKQTVKLTAAEGAAIYYTTDGSKPTTKSKKYKGAITVSENCTISAIAKKDGCSASNMMCESYVITKKAPGETYDFNKKNSTDISDLDMNYSDYDAVMDYYYDYYFNYYNDLYSGNNNSFDYTDYYNDYWNYSGYDYNWDYGGSGYYDDSYWDNYINWILGDDWYSGGSGNTNNSSNNNSNSGNSNTNDWNYNSNSGWNSSQNNDTNNYWDDYWNNYWNDLFNWDDDDWDWIYGDTNTTPTNPTNPTTPTTPTTPTNPTTPTTPTTPSGSTTNTTPTQPSGTDNTSEIIKTVEFKWNDGYNSWSWSVDIPKYLYNYAVNHPNYASDRVNYDYVKYATDTTDDAFIAGMVKEFRNAASSAGYSEEQYLNMLITFVQNIDYVSDYQSHGKSEYPKYPVETLYDKNGDCEDSAALLASLFKASGYKAAMIEFDDHMAAGIAGSFSGTSFTSGGAKYYFVETTYPGWGIGEYSVNYQYAYVLPV